MIWPSAHDENGVGKNTFLLFRRKHRTKWVVSSVVNKLPEIYYNAFWSCHPSEYPIRSLSQTWADFLWRVICFAFYHQFLPTDLPIRSLMSEIKGIITLLLLKTSRECCSLSLCCYDQCFQLQLLQRDSTLVSPHFGLWNPETVLLRSTLQSLVQRSGCKGVHNNFTTWSLRPSSSRLRFAVAKGGNFIPAGPTTQLLAHGWIGKP